MKYVRRGFRISADPFCLADNECDEDIKDSAKTGYCPHKVRSTVDDEVLRWEFEKTQVLGDTTITCQDVKIMVWCLGGDECAESNKEQTMSMMFVSA